MRLTAIKLAGFKSFVDPTTLRVPGRLTGVVGPNGCGKSNVIDAVRWVLGEISAKQLRGEASQDVIFNGSRSRKPVGRASVEITFDNTDGKLGGQYAAFAEIAVKREITRDGDSRYSINGTHCRRRDVIDLFLGTGLGGRSNYAIIEQGMLGQLIEAKPEDVRMLLEEAAGISKYKDRRRETESRIRESRDNLARLNDLLGELRKRLEQLKRQSENANKYTDLKQTERRLRAELLLLREQALQVESVEKTRLLETARQYLADQQSAIQQLAQQRTAVQSRHQAAQQQCQTLQGDLYTAEAELARIEQSLSHARDLHRNKQRDLDGVTQQQQVLTQRQQQETSRRQSLLERIRQLEGALGTADANEVDVREQLNAAETAAQAALEQWETFNHDAQQPLADEAAERARVEQMQRQHIGLQNRLRQLEQERAQIQLPPMEAAVQQANDQLAQLAQELTRIQAESTAHDAQVANLREQRSELDNQLHEVRQALQNTHGRLASIEALQQAALREDDPRLRRWLAEQGQPTLKRLAQCIEVESGWERAVESVLGEFLQALCVEQLDQQLTQIASWPELPLILVDVGAPADAATPANSLASKVKGPAVIRALLSTVLLAESETDAASLRHHLQLGQSLVTRAGLCHGALWVRSAGGGKDAKADGVLAREQVLKTLRGDVQQLSTRKTALETRFNAVREQQTSAESTRHALQRQLDDLRRRHHQLQSAHQSQTLKLEQARNRAMTLAQDCAAQQQAEQQLQQELTQSRTRSADLTRIAQQLAQDRQRLQETLRIQREQLNSAHSARERAVADSQRLRVELAGLQSASEAAQRLMQDLVQRSQQLSQQHATLGEALQQAATSITEPEHAQQRGRGRRAEVQQQLDAARKHQAQIESEAQTLTHQTHEAEQQLETRRDAVQQAQLAQQALSVRQQGYLDQLAETGYELDALRAGLAEGAAVTPWEEQLATTERRIQRLGAINLAAVSEFAEESQREQHLSAQHDDLTQALNALEEAIRKIDSETRTRFQETFEQVNATFRTIFPKLFGGGEAILELSSDDLLQAGVRVMARPPGKRNSTIHQLSGGEKALTAVSLLFALFELNPAPFCMLDEVDAPLDDANVSRFCELVREMSSHVQFIVITHNKVTMEMMEQLNGVTMQEPGVSRLVSVDMQQALALAS